MINNKATSTTPASMTLPPAMATPTNAISSSASGINQITPPQAMGAQSWQGGQTWHGGPNAMGAQAWQGGPNAMGAQVWQGSPNAMGATAWQGGPNAMGAQAWQGGPNAMGAQAWQGGPNAMGTAAGNSGPLRALQMVLERQAREAMAKQQMGDASGGPSKPRKRKLMNATSDPQRIEDRSLESFPLPPWARPMPQHMVEKFERRKRKSKSAP